MDNKKVISTLNDLIETSKDGEEGFTSCAEDIKDLDAQLKMLFVDKAHSCALAATELQEIVLAQGGEPATHSTVVGTLHRNWIDIKSAVLGKDKVAILNECERGEDHAIRSYRKALEEDLPPVVRDVVERQYQGVLQNHDRIKSLRDQVRASN